MKKVLKTLGAIALLAASSLFIACQGLVAGDEINNYATTKVSKVSFTTAKACPGVNILRWNAVENVVDYSVYRTKSGGHVELLLTPSAITELYYVDFSIDQESTYTYRIVAHPTIAAVRDDSSTTVTLSTGTWPAEATDFNHLEGGSSNGLTSDNISVKLYPTSKSNSVLATFPVKPYAAYRVALSQVNGGLVGSNETVESYIDINGFDFDGKATVLLTGLYEGVKQVTVIAQPLNYTLYGASVVASSKTVEIVEAETLSSAVTGNNIFATWTNYNSSTKMATARVSFEPASLDGDELAASEYTIYRALYDSNGETVSVQGEDIRAYTSITSLGSPSKDIEKSTADTTIYYIDDAAIDLSWAEDIKGVRFYVVLNHNGRFETEEITLEVPGTSDSDWNFTPASGTTVTPATNSIDIYDISISEKGIVTLKAEKYSSSETVTGTYGAFATKNEALAAVNSELPTALTPLTTDEESSSSYYWTATTGSIAVDPSKYYVFRVVSSLDNSSQSVDHVIAKPVAVTGGYYWDVIKGNPENYATVSAPTVTVTDKKVGTKKYESVTLSYYASNAQYYNIWRDSTLLASRTTDTSFTDSSDDLKATDIDTTIYYYVEAVSYYNRAETTKTVASIAAPVVTKSGTSLSWNEVSKATTYYIYRATTEAALKALSESNSYDYTTTESFTASQSWSTDYFYGVRAYSSTLDVYSDLSNVIEVKKVSKPNVSYSNYKLTWSSIEGAVYYIYRATSESALSNLSTTDTYDSTTSTSFEVPYSLTDDYYYAVRAYNSSENIYSDLSDSHKVEKITVVTSNPATWQLISSGTYTFAIADDSNVWTSNNAGHNSTSATTTWAIGVSEDNVEISIPWTVSSESGYDKFTLVLDDETKVSAASGTESGTVTATLSAGVHTLTATYSKDSSSNSGSDTATLTLDPVVY